MGRKVACSVLILLLGRLVVSSASSSRLPQSKLPAKEEHSQKDITNPVATVPTIIPAPYTTSTSPLINPMANPDSVATPSVPVDNFASSPPSLSSSWCFASPGSSQLALQVALDYACGYGGTDCSDIQPGGKCYYPNSIRDHASYAFNKYYQNNPIPTSCNFVGNALVTSTEARQYPSMSTSSSILNTTNASGDTVFGVVPSGPTTSAAARSRVIPSYVEKSFVVMSSLMLVAYVSVRKIF